MLDLLKYISLPFIHTLGLCCEVWNGNIFKHRYMHSLEHILGSPCVCVLGGDQSLLLSSKIGFPNIPELSCWTHITVTCTCFSLLAFIISVTVDMVSMASANTGKKKSCRMDWNIGKQIIYVGARHLELDRKAFSSALLSFETVKLSQVKGGVLPHYNKVRGSWKWRWERHRLMFSSSSFRVAVSSHDINLIYHAVVETQ